TEKPLHIARIEMRPSPRLLATAAQYFLNRPKRSQRPTEQRIHRPSLRQCRARPCRWRVENRLPQCIRWPSPRFEKAFAASEMLIGRRSIDPKPDCFEELAMPVAADWNCLKRERTD